MLSVTVEGLVFRHEILHRATRATLSLTWKTTVKHRSCLDIVRGTNYLLESLGIDRRIRSVAEFASPILIPIYEKICTYRLDGSHTCRHASMPINDCLSSACLDIRLPVRNLVDEIHNIQCVINALCFDTVEFDLSHISGEQVANGDLYAMEDLLEILTDVYHWIKHDRDEASNTGKRMRSSDDRIEHLSPSSSRSTMSNSTCTAEF